MGKFHEHIRKRLSSTFVHSAKTDNVELSASIFGTFVSVFRANLFLRDNC